MKAALASPNRASRGGIRSERVESREVLHGCQTSSGLPPYVIRAAPLALWLMVAGNGVEGGGADRNAVTGRRRFDQAALRLARSR